MKHHTFTIPKRNLPQSGNTKAVCQLILGNYFISSTLGHFATFDMCLTLLFYTGLQFSFNTVIPYSTHSGSTYLHTNQRFWLGCRYTNFEATVRVSEQPGCPRSSAGRAPGEGAGRRTGVGAPAVFPRVSSRHCHHGWHRCLHLLHGWHRRILPVWGRPLPNPPDGKRASRALLPEPCHVQSLAPSYSGVSFLAPCFGSTTEGLQPCNSFSVCWFAELLLGIFSSIKERSIFNFKAHAACIFCPSDLDLACSEINHYNI